MVTGAKWMGLIRTMTPTAKDAECVEQHLWARKGITGNDETMEPSSRVAESCILAQTWHSQRRRKTASQGSGHWVTMWPMQPVRELSNAAMSSSRARQRGIGGWGLGRVGGMASAGRDRQVQVNCIASARLTDRAAAQDCNLLSRRHTSSPHSMHCRQQLSGLPV